MSDPPTPAGTANTDHRPPHNRPLPAPGRIVRRGRRWWQQAPPRRRLLSATAAGATIAVLALAGIATGTSGEQQPPEDLVTAYLAALQRGDAQRALAIARFDPDDWEPSQDAFLDADVLTGGWSAQRVVRRYPWRNGTATVDVTLSATDGTTGQARFRLVRNHQDSPWRLMEPFSQIHLRHSPVDHIEINGVARPAASPAALPLLLFPGIYRGWPQLDAILAGAPTVVLATPGIIQELQPRWQLSPNGQHRAQQAINAYLDRCTESNQLQPPQCPFGGDTDYIAAGDDRYSDVTSPQWEIIEYPHVLAVPGGGNYAVAPRREGTVRLRGTGTPLSGEDSDWRAFHTRCPIDVSTLTLHLTTEGGFSVAGREGVVTCRF